jgi:hypothetical protein
MSNKQASKKKTVSRSSAGDIVARVNSILNGNFVIEHESTKNVLEHIKKSGKGKELGVIVSGVLHGIFFSAYGMSLSMEFDTSSKNRLFGKGAIFMKESKLKTPWFTDKSDKTLFNVKVGKADFLDPLSTGKDQDGNPIYTLGLKVDMTVRVSAYFDFPEVGKAGFTLVLAGEVRAQEEEDDIIIGKRKKTQVPSAPSKKSRSSTIVEDAELSDIAQELFGED